MNNFVSKMNEKPKLNPITIPLYNNLFLQKDTKSMILFIYFRNALLHILSVSKELLGLSKCLEADVCWYPK